MSFLNATLIPLHCRKAGIPEADARGKRMDTLRSFFSDLIEWEWIHAHFDPKRALSLPLSIRAQIGPNPRIIDDVAWAKLMAAGLTLNAEDLNRYGTPAARQVGHTDSYYPIEMVRALVAVSDEGTDENRESLPHLPAAGSAEKDVGPVQQARRPRSGAGRRRLEACPATPAPT